MDNKYITLFKTTSEYQEYRLSSGFTSPNVSLCEDENKIYFSESKNEDILNNNYEYVDLGLPSGTIWAKYNVGAVSEDDGNGLYFAWGDITGWTKRQIENHDTDFSWGRYIWTDSAISCDGSAMKKYNEEDGKNVLDMVDDAAHVYMGGDWHMPSVEQFEELLDYTTTAWTTQNGVDGLLFTSNINNKTLFFPAFGYADNYTIDNLNSCFYWSMNNETVQTANYFMASESDIYVTDDFKHYGLPIRGVIG